MFFPAPYVQLAAPAAANGTLGTNYSVDLSGAISNDSFFVELENASTGHVVSSRSNPGATPNATILAVGLRFESASELLTPGAMLLHVHNACGAMLLSQPVRGVYARNASLTVSENPSVCGPVMFNGTWIAPGTVVPFVPSHAPIPIRAGSCGGLPFQRWTVTGTLNVTAALSNHTTLRAANNGALTATYS
jgi:hypothetical protein